ncbi:hypothetical protein [Phenylobacterium sp.]|uniref:hypothetical protein n=1 Tax=Phenylobacterium sp. TaxID=1871053 RepID=UPI0012250D63|nr:hypothetical protein [Phenylobacterium sp.]THD51710.1 MAG: hypothetical protein E8A12_20630 [Phenylobacterium sp.]
MAEKGGLIGGVLGGEDAEAADAETTAGLDPIAAALATSAMERGQPLDSRLASYLAQQEKLVGIQTEHLHEQSEVILDNLKLKRLNERMKLLFQGVAAAIGATVLAILGGVVFEAARSYALIIEPFSVPPDLAQQGLTGQTIAHQFQDRLVQLEQRSGSARAAASFETSWGKDVKVEIPETGVSLGEMERFLRERLGHDTHITGEVFHTGPNLTLSVQAGEDDEARASGDPASLEGLIETAAEGVFARTQPYRYATWLGQTGRKSEAVAALRRLAATGSREDRLWAWAGLNNYSDSAREARWDLQQGLKIDPEFSHLWFDLAGVAQSLGDDEAALQAAATSLRFLPRDRGKRIAELTSNWEAAIERSIIAFETADFHAEIAALQAMEDLPVPHHVSYLEGLAQWLPYRRAADFAALHDLARAQALLGGAPDDLSVARAAGTSAVTIDAPHAVMAADRGDWAEAARQLEPLAATTVPGEQPEQTATEILPALAIAYAHLGRLADARTLVQKSPTDCYTCLIARAEVESVARNWPAADRWFAAADRRGPSLPRAQEASGESRLARGDLSGAAAAFNEAARRAPNWADPLKGLGDVAARRRDWRRAVHDYDKALKITPNWLDLKRAREQAASHLR